MYSGKLKYSDIDTENIIVNTLAPGKMSSAVLDFSVNKLRVT